MCGSSAKSNEAAALPCELVFITHMDCIYNHPKSHHADANKGLCNDAIKLLIFLHEGR